MRFYIRNAPFRQNKKGAYCYAPCSPWISKNIMCSDPPLIVCSDLRVCCCVCIVITSCKHCKHRQAHQSRKHNCNYPFHIALISCIVSPNAICTVPVAYCLIPANAIPVIVPVYVIIIIAVSCRIMIIIICSTAAAAVTVAAHSQTMSR